MTTASPAISRVLAGELCSGCGLCAGVSDTAVSMTTVAPGYSRPIQKSSFSAETEEKIEKCCPGSNVASWKDELWRDAAKDNIFWGPWRRCMTGHAVNPDLRYAASSGGALSALAAHALKSGLVQRVLHVTADPERPTRNQITLSSNTGDIVAGAGSRYAASSPLEAIDKLLDQGLRFAFIGKPCDVSALRQLSRMDERVDRLIPLKLSFFCGGIPSHDGADRIIESMGLEPQEIDSFRYRGQGWPGLTKAVTKKGESGEMRYADSWGGHLSKEVQFRCKICADAVGGVADIACADAWYGGESGYPQFEEADGRSLIIARTKAGEQLIRDAVANDILEVENLPIDEIILMQPSQARRKRLVGARMAACRLMFQPIPKTDGLDVKIAQKQSTAKEYLRDLLGTIRRIVLKRR